MKVIGIKKVRRASAVTVAGLFSLAVSIVWAAAQATESSKVTLEEVLAIEADPDYGKYLASECMTCHSTGKSDSTIPMIHGQEVAYLADALLQYKSRARKNATMQSVAGALGVEEMAALAAFFSQLKQEP